MIYARFNDSMILEPFEIPADWRRAGGIDFGYKHPTAAVWLARNPEGTYYLYQEYKQRAELRSSHAQNLAKGNLYGRLPE
jgi:hypothetical protein